MISLDKIGYNHCIMLHDFIIYLFSYLLPKFQSIFCSHVKVMRSGKLLAVQLCSRAKNEGRMLWLPRIRRFVYHRVFESIVVTIVFLFLPTFKVTGILLLLLDLNFQKLKTWPLRINLQSYARYFLPMLSSTFDDVFIMLFDPHHRNTHGTRRDDRFFPLWFSLFYC